MMSKDDPYRDRKVYHFAAHSSTDGTALARMVERWGRRALFGRWRYLPAGTQSIAVIPLPSVVRIASAK